MNWAKIRAQFLKNFIAGITVLIPLYLTVYIVGAIFSAFDKFTHLLPRDWRAPFLFPGSGLLMAVLLSTFIGVLARNYLGTALVSLINSLLERIPLISSIYGPLRQISEMVLGSGGKKSFSRVVLVEWPRKECWTLAFVTAQTQARLRQHLNSKLGEGEMLNLFVPATPNPTSGFFMVVSSREVMDVNISVDQAFKLILSAGALSLE